MQEWFEEFDEALWLKPEPEAPAEAVSFIAEVLKLKKGDLILDLPCGAGRLSFPLARTGSKVHGIDRSGNFIKKASVKAKESGLQIEFEQMDMRKISFKGIFDAVLNWGGSFGYFSDAENGKLMKAMSESLKPGGRIVVDQPNRIWILDHFISEGEVKGYKTRTEWRTVTGRLVTQYQKADSDKCFELIVRLYSLEEMKSLFSKAGLTLENTHGSTTGGEFTKDSKRLICVGKRT